MHLNVKGIFGRGKKSPCFTHSPAYLPGLNAGRVLTGGAAGFHYLSFPKYDLQRAAIVCIWHALFVRQLKKWKSEVFSYMGSDPWSLCV